MHTEPMSERQKMLLALAITEWASVSAHLESMEQRGIAVPPALVLHLSRELGFLYRRWPVQADSVEQAMAQARRYVTEHLPEAEVLIDQTRGEG